MAVFSSEHETLKKPFYTLLALSVNILFCYPPPDYSLSVTL
ncbi:hypothetical protein CF65_01655 [Aggregatibacter actinomycetemcomitans HK1651]|nr:hypothetical protein CF65_01655 [Aggregatibacter actinomycetemcomitans HK1651]